MKKLLFLFLLTSTIAQAEPRGYTIPFHIRFPWGVCHVLYYSRYVRYPALIRGYACGAYVRCIRVQANRYRCQI